MTGEFAVVMQVGEFVPRGTRQAVFQQIYWVFLVLGTLVGVVVVGYMLYLAVAYRAGPDEADDDGRPKLGEIPQGGGKGRKLFLSFALSAVIVISLIVWTYGTLLFVEQPASAQEQEELEVEVTGQRFQWVFTYPNGHQTIGELRVPEDTRVRLVVTSSDVFHNFGIPALRAKTDAIPGQTSDTWFMAEETGTYAAHCYELCGSGHSDMNADVVVMEEEEFQQWYENTSNGSENGNRNGNESA
jgi:cytochrome c oxidase subunit 2